MATLCRFESGLRHQVSMKSIFLASVVAAITAASIMSYVALATPLGPWIEPVLVLSLLAIMRLARQRHNTDLLVAVSASGGVAGIAAVACSFSYPTLFFLEPALFGQWLAAPFCFMGGLASLIITTGGIAFVLVELCQEQFLGREDLPFPLVKLVSKLVSVHDNAPPRSTQFCKGVVGCLMVTGAQKLMVSSSLSSDSSLLVALGYGIGHTIALPLAVGCLMKLTLLDGLKNLFTQVSARQLVFAWCAGMVGYGALESVIHMVRSLSFYRLRSVRLTEFVKAPQGFVWSGAFGIPVVLVSSGLVLRFFTFSWPSIIFLWIATIIGAHQLLLIGAKIGLAPLGRYALLITLGGLAFFRFTSVHLSIAATFVELCGGIAVDLMFGRKLANLTESERVPVRLCQAIGLIIGALTVSFMMWLLSTQVGIGQPPLIAQRAATRALLVKVHDFHLASIVLGACCAYILARLKINPVLVMSGLFMPLNYVAPLIGGSLIGKLSKDSEYYYPAWAGVFATASLMTLLGLFWH